MATMELILLDPHVLSDGYLLFFQHPYFANIYCSIRINNPLVPYRYTRSKIERDKRLISFPAYDWPIVAHTRISSVETHLE